MTSITREQALEMVATGRPAMDLIREAFAMGFAFHVGATVEALQIGLECAQEVATNYHESMKGYRPERHAAYDADVAKIEAAIQSLQGVSQQQSQVGNFGDSSAEQISRKVAALPLPDYSQASQDARKVRHAFENIRSNYVGWQDNQNFKVLEAALFAAIPQVRTEIAAEAELPPLPEPAGAIDVDLGPAGPEYMEGARMESAGDGYSAAQMREYARAAIAQRENGNDR